MLFMYDKILRKKKKRRGNWKTRTYDKAQGPMFNIL